MREQEFTAAVEREARRILDGTAACHDWDHTRRVLHNAHELLNALPDADVRVVEAAVLLHDIGRPRELASGGELCHAQLGAEMARGILNELGADAAFTEHVCDCIRTHRYRTRQPELRPATLEAQIVYDADKLDSLGAVGIARSFHFASRIGARIHNTEAEALGSPSFSREDTAYREYLVKLRHLPGRMLTEPGRARADMLLAFMDAFFQELNAETHLNHAQTP